VNLSRADALSQIALAEPDLRRRPLHGAECRVNMLSMLNGLNLLNLRSAGCHSPA
jgi:hypothetical protein